MSERERGRVHVEGSAIRCPYCHEAIADEGADVSRLVCAECLARHHAACWWEGGACASCGRREHLVRERADEAEGGLDAHERRLLWSLLVGGLLFVGGGAFVGGVVGAGVGGSAGGPGGAALGAVAGVVVGALVGLALAVTLAGVLF